MLNAQVIILDFGSQFTQLIAREVRKLGVYNEIYPCTIAIEELKKKNPSAIILSGGPASVQIGPKMSNAILEWGIPVLGICYGMQLLSHLKKGKLNQGKTREYGASEIEILDSQGIFHGFAKNKKVQVWMSHGDSVESLPPGAKLLAKSEQCPIVAFEIGKVYGVQFHPEVHHTTIGREVLSNFLFRISKLRPDWTFGDFLAIKEKELRELVGNKRIIGAVSGGVDSSILAIFLNRIFPKQFFPVFVDHGLLRENESMQVVKSLKDAGVNLKVLNAKKIFLDRLKKVKDPEKKRKIIGKTFIEVFEKECKKISKVDFLAQGTLYPDVIESVSVKGPSHTIKTHHNVGGLPKKMNLQLIEPFRELFKDDVRILGEVLQVPKEIIYRHPFPGPGLSLRILGEVTEAKLNLLRQADTIFIEELKSSGLYDKIWQAFTVLLPVQSVGVMGDARTYENAIALRAVTSRDGMTADWYSFDKPILEKISNRIVNQVKGINRVVYDITSKPPATIEWE